MKNIELLGPHYRDLWCLDLEKLDAWRALPPYPIPESVSGRFVGWSMVVHNDKAYLFTGRPQLDIFDLVAGKWGNLGTTFNADAKRIGAQRWPYTNQKLTDYTMQLVDEKLYVFGGCHDGSHLGCNVLMVLDLETLEWQLLSGTPKPKADFACPGPRKHPVSWIDKDGSRMYVMYGEADRPAAQAFGERPYGAQDGYVYGDMWSWGIQDEKWRKERMTGNPPAPRSEVASTYVRITPSLT